MLLCSEGFDVGNGGCCDYFGLVYGIFFGGDFVFFGCEGDMLVVFVIVFECLVCLYGGFEIFYFLYVFCVEEIFDGNV